MSTPPIASASTNERKVTSAVSHSGERTLGGVASGCGAAGVACTVGGALTGHLRPPRAPDDRRHQGEPCAAASSRGTPAIIRPSTWREVSAAHDPDDVAPVHDDDAVGEGEHLVQLGAHDEHRSATVALGDHPGVEELDRADVHTTGRLGRQSRSGPRQRPRHHQLLLVAARQRDWLGTRCPVCVRRTGRPGAVETSGSRRARSTPRRSRCTVDTWSSTRFSARENDETRPSCRPVLRHVAHVVEDAMGRLGRAARCRRA